MSVETAGVERATLQNYLYAHIPISAAMGVEVVDVSEESVRLRAPLEPNINHRSTVFGGSAAAVATLAGWALLHTRLSQAGQGSRIVIQRSSVEYTNPIDDDFESLAMAPAVEAWNRFVATIRRHGRARIEIAVDLRLGDVVVGKFVGTYVVVPRTEQD